MPILHWLNDEEARKTSSRVPYRLLEADGHFFYPDFVALLNDGRKTSSRVPYRLLEADGHFFYPDFVALLNDGRIFVIEYKGAIYVDASQEKKNIGERWEEKSDNKALFLLAVMKDEKGRDVRKQIEEKIG